ncbi:MAG: SCO family protein, partial [Flavobacteriales bacterium]
VRVQSILGEEPGFIILSHTVDPERDTPEVLRQYADKFGAHTGNWHFLTGPKEDIYDLGWNGYYLSMAENKDSGGGFIHSPKFTLVDRQGHIRGWYDGTDAAEVDRMIVDIRSLL